MNSTPRNFLCLHSIINLMRMTFRARFVPAVFVAVTSACCAAFDANPAFGSEGGQFDFMIATGDVRLQLDYSQSSDKLIGGAFALGVRNGAASCFINSLMQSPNQTGQIAFSLEPPAGDGPFRITLDSTGTLDAHVVKCVRSALSGFYHYANRPPFKNLPGKLLFTPQMRPAPVPPTETVVRTLVDAAYAKQLVVKVVQFELKSTSYGTWNPDLVRSYSYHVELEFIADGYETNCHHGRWYKVFGPAPYSTRAAGHVCENQPRKIGDHTVDHGVIYFRLHDRSVAKGWEFGYTRTYYCGDGHCPDP
jgi:hypothetical protein